MELLDLAEVEAMKKGRFIVLGIGLLLVSGCGSGTDPVYALGDPSDTDGPGLILPLVNLIGFNAPFSSTNDGFDLLSQGIGTAVRSPGGGLVVGADLGSSTVTLLHNAHVQTRVQGLIPSVTVGSFIAQGATLGTVNLASGIIHFTVLLDRSAVCPLSYLNASGRTQLAGMAQPTTLPCM